MAELVKEAISNPDFVVLARYGLPTADLGALDRWVRAHFRYRPEAEEVVRTVFFQLAQLEKDGIIEGDCDDVSTLYAAILKASGYVARFVAIRFDADEFQHVFVETHAPVPAGAHIDWRVCDPTVPEETIHYELERMTQDV